MDKLFSLVENLYFVRIFLFFCCGNFWGQLVREMKLFWDECRNYGEKVKKVFLSTNYPLIVPLRILVILTLCPQVKFRPKTFKCKYILIIHYIFFVILILFLDELVHLLDIAFRLTDKHELL